MVNFLLFNEKHEKNILVLSFFKITSIPFLYYLVFIMQRFLFNDKLTLFLYDTL